MVLNLLTSDGKLTHPLHKNNEDDTQMASPSPPYRSPPPPPHAAAPSPPGEPEPESSGSGAGLAPPLAQARTPDATTPRPSSRTPNPASPRSQAPTPDLPSPRAPTPLRSPSPLQPGAPQQRQPSAEDIQRAAEDREREVQAQLQALQLQQGENGGEEDQILDPFASNLDHLIQCQDYIKMISEASLDNDLLPEWVLSRLRDPRTPEEDGGHFTANELHTLKLYLANFPYPEEAYKRNATVFNASHPGPDDVKVYSLQQARRLVEDVTGVIGVFDDMCINSCMAFTGPLQDLDKCNVCDEPRYNVAAQQKDADLKIPRQQMCTIPLGPQLQALRGSLSGSEDMKYRHEMTQELLQEHFTPDEYHDIFCGKEYINLAKREGITSDDITIGFSIDGAQLYQNKKSDTWIGVWVVYDYDPKVRYKRKHILPALIIPGPNKAKNQDSFLYRAFYHLSALQREDNMAGLSVYDYAQGEVVKSRIFFITATADAVGLVELDGRVGHHGAQGCRIGCSWKGRHKPGAGHYYTPHLRPNEYLVEGCTHPDFDFTTIPVRPTLAQYREKLQQVLRSRTQAEYHANRKETGICKPSILSALSLSRSITSPFCFGLDLMHLFHLNIPQLFCGLWRGTIAAEGDDHHHTWQWRVLTGDTWKEHGETVASTTKYFPSDHHRPPRNIADKINSGYTAVEWYHWLYGLGPGLLRPLLPNPFWKHICMLIRAVRILSRRILTEADITEAQLHTNTFVRDFEMMYYKRNPHRLHFCRPALHTLLHAPAEVRRVGPGAFTTQFPMEITIGTLGGTIRQHGTPFANLTEVAIRQCQINALLALYPELEKEFDTNVPPPGQIDCGNGYILKPFRDESRTVIEGHMGDVLFEEYETRKIRRWGRLEIPNEQTIRSRFSEERSYDESQRVTRMIKVQTVQCYDLLYSP